MSVRFRTYRSPIDVQCYPKCIRLGENVPDLRPELSGERRVVFSSQLKSGGTGHGPLTGSSVVYDEAIKRELNRRHMKVCLLLSNKAKAK